PLTLVPPSIYLSWRTTVWLSPVNGRYTTTVQPRRYDHDFWDPFSSTTHLAVLMPRGDGWHQCNQNRPTHHSLHHRCTPVFIAHTYNSPATSNTGVHHHNYPNGHQPTRPHVHPTRRHPTHPNLPCYPSSVRD
ncbi:hypothetical protein HID58_090181, partial [Brassica napus]